MLNPCPSTAAQPEDFGNEAGAYAGTPYLLWAAWALSVVGAATWIWWGAASADQPLDITFLVVRCTLVGLAGLIVLTLIEMRLAPRRFLD